MQIPEKLIFEELSKIFLGVWEIHFGIRFVRVFYYLPRTSNKMGAPSSECKIDHANFID